MILTERFCLIRTSTFGGEVWAEVVVQADPPEHLPSCPEVQEKDDARAPEAHQV